MDKTIFALFTAWVFEYLFSFSEVVIYGVKELLGMEITLYSYYFLALFYGVIRDLISDRQQAK